MSDKTSLTFFKARFAENGATMLCAALAAWITVTLCHHSTLFNRWDDWLWRLAPPYATGSNIFLVDIDEKSLALHGRWPWSRERLADLLDRLLTRHHAAVVGVDIILSEPGDGEGNTRLAALDKDSVVWAHAASMFDEPVIRQGSLTTAPACPDNIPWSRAVNGWLGLTAEIGGNNFRAGHIRPWLDSDHVVRTYQPFLAYEGKCIPGLGLAMYAALMGLPADAPLEKNASGAWSWDGIPLGLEQNGRLRLDWQAHRLKAIPAHRVLAGQISLPENAVMIVGSTAVGIGDFVSTPVADRFAGVGVHALALRQWLDRDFIVKPWYHDLLAGILLIPIFVTFWLTSRSATLKPWLMAIGFFILWNGLSLLLMTKNIVLNAEAMLWALVWLPAIQGMRLWQEKKARNIIYQQFHAYLPEKVLQELIDSKVDPRQLQAEEREITVLFADLRGFTSISENMASEDVVALLNEVMEYLSHHISNFEGTLDKFMGDCVMAFWGAPVEMADHADRAVSCAITMLDNLQSLNDKLKDRGLPPVSLGIGINTGQVAVGNMGAVDRKNYSAVGDAVNTAARLEQFCKVLKCSLLIGADTAKVCRKQELRKLQVIEVRGKKRRVHVFASTKYLPQVPQVKKATEPRNTTIPPP